MQRLIVVYNPRSSQYVHVKSEILDHLHTLKSCAIGKFTIKKTNFEENATQLAQLLEDDDLVISLGGDATAAITVNAIMQSNKKVVLSVWPYGNFNDLARTLKTTRRQDFFKVILSFLEEKSTKDTTKTPKNATKSPKNAVTATKTSKLNKKVVQLYPLEIIVDGAHWRYASCYVTMGMTAEACEIFDDAKIRHSLQKGHKSAWRSYFYLAKWYFQNRHTKTFIPEFTLNKVVQPMRTSDYAAVSGRSMCRVMRGRDDYLRPRVFRSCTGRLTNFWRLFDLMVKSIIHRVPGVETTQDVIEFANPATVELQAEGEYKVFKDIYKIEIKKGTKCLQVIQN